MISHTLLLLYAGLMVWAAATAPLPAWAKALTACGSGSLILSLWWGWAVPLGLLLLLVAAYVNGTQLGGHHWSHLLIRLGLSALLLGLWVFSRP
ncbi:hypothetical protein [Lacticaseibacillus daqingensis]|uniref:hypothetical protein n=1 Tax=Lacticaseibacillus daqingensis TaxID=2486014 RepID=UPI000F7A161C|nr:hypothetical protein [Lacticaseibacillus daqingensis]